MAMNKILKDVGFSIIDQYTYNYKHDLNPNIAKRIVIRLIKSIAAIIPNANDNLFIVARKAEAIKIPFSI